MLNQPDYTRYAEYYDFFELAGFSESKNTNSFLVDLFGINGVQTVVDFACGTGAQTIGLAKAGFKLTASDLNPEMVKVAQKKSKRLKNITFCCGDMCREKYGTFDAAICMFNAIGHLNRAAFLKFLLNAKNNLNAGGLLVFDILNYEAMKTSIFEEYAHMSKEVIIKDHLISHVRNCTLNKRKKQIEISSLICSQDGTHKPEKWSENWQMQIYTSDQIVRLLNKAGFKEIQIFGLNGTPFNNELSDSILAVAQK